MSAESPWALPVSTEEELPSVNIAPPTEGAGAVVALVADPGPRQDGWSARVAVSLAREWAGDGLRIFLADGDLSHPSIHRIVGGENGEGVADAVVYGASPGRIGRPVPDGGFIFASAGTVVPNPEEAYAHPRWSALLGAFRESESVLLLYLPSETGGGLDALVAQADRVVRLSAGAPETDPGNGHLYIHPAPRDATASEGQDQQSDVSLGGDSEGALEGRDEAGSAADAGSPGNLETIPGDAEGTAEGEASEFVLADDFPGGEAWPEDDAEDWVDTGELQITEEWAGEGPSAREPGDPAVAEEEAWSAPEGEVGATEAAESPEETRVGDVDEVEATDHDGIGPVAGPGWPADGAGSDPTEVEPSERIPSPSRDPAEERGSRVEGGTPAGEEAPRPRPVRAGPVERNLTPWLLVILAVLVAAILLASWLGYVTIPGITFAPEPGGVGLAAPAAPILPPPG